MLLYQYQSLPRFTPGNHYFRLIDLHPSDDKNEPLQIKIRTVRLEDGPVYECLSYVWGTPPSSSQQFHDTVSVRSACDDSEEASMSPKIRISPNLNAALRTLRLPSETRTLWADALCINQLDIAERNSQITLMGLIFFSATRVNIYLGPDPTNSAKLAFENMVPISHMHWGHHVPGIAGGDKVFDSTGQPAMDLPTQDASWRAISEFYSLEWFTRAWVQQEIGLSREAFFYWGEHHVQPETRDIFGFDIWLEHSPRGESLRDRYISRVEAVRGTRNVWLQYGQVTRAGWLRDEAAVREHLEGNPFLVVLLDASACTARDPRDCVYAFLGHPSARVPRKMADGGEGRLCGVDYREMMFATIDGGWR